MSDGELLRQYVQLGSEEAFTALVMRYLNFVYSSARRQVGSEAVARDVAQSVFIELAGKAKSLRADSHLASWLHVVTRRTSIDALRRESSRRRRELEAVEAAALGVSDSPWAAIEPLLDEAVSSLDAGDRAAVLLRYFEDKSFREIGAILGVSDDTAQKRLSRAVDRLRIHFSDRGVQATAAAIAAGISANAVQAAPASLAAAVTTALSASGAALHHAALIHAARNITMTTTQKTMVVAALAAAIGGGLYQQGIIHRQAARISALEQQAVSRDEAAGAAHVVTSSKAASAATNMAGTGSPMSAASASAGAGSKVDPSVRLKILEELQERKILNSKMVFVDPVGKLSPTFVELFSLSPDEQASLQKSVDEARRQMGDLMVANATVTSTGPNNVTISVKPLDGGPAVGDGLMSAFAATLGTERNAAFVALGSSQLEEALGNFGAVQETISITDNASGAPGSPPGYTVVDSRDLPNHMQMSLASTYPSLDEVTARWPIAPLVPKTL
jgi:RNA polymerase sigma factor (sigma-70 family)